MMIGYFRVMKYEPFLKISRKITVQNTGFSPMLKIKLSITFATNFRSLLEYYYLSFFKHHFIVIKKI